MPIAIGFLGHFERLNRPWDRTASLSSCRAVRPFPESASGSCWEVLNHLAGPADFADLWLWGPQGLQRPYKERVPSGVRQHASDVGFVELPDDATTRRDPKQTAVSLPTLQPPDYLNMLGNRHGVTFASDTWSFGPPRGFASQKVIFGLNHEDGSEVIAKLTQRPVFNARLQAEADALRSLNQLPRAQDGNPYAGVC